MKTRTLAITLLAFCVLGCTDFERTSFQTLSASKAAIDTAQADYEARTIPHNACSYAIINDAKGIQTAAVDALQVYDKVRVAKGDLTAETAVVSASLLQLAPVVVKVQSLITNPAVCGGK
ncbi:MAG TPA: hypothetical protein VN517_03745 [Terriglobales bacterium]|nr:hypothetical protein [Terriglobales bacterium]